MRDAGLAAVVVASPENIYYLTGLDHLGYFAVTLLVVPCAGEPTLITRDMERPTVRAQLPGHRQVTFGDGESPAVAAAGVLAEFATGVVGFDDKSMYFPAAVAAEIRASLPGMTWASSTDLLAAQRAVKSDDELDVMRHAATVCDLAMARGIAALRPGAVDHQVAAEVYRAIVLAGGQPPGFPPLIRPTTILDQEHVSWSDRMVSAGTGWFLEISASVRRYHAPQSRTVYLGHAPAAAAEAADAAFAGLLAARDALQPGISTGAVYQAWQRAVATRTGGDGPSRHHCGYLVGIGFPPSWVGGGQVLGICPGGDTVVEAGMTFHLMSWVNRPTGHVISDTALVTATGCELLTGTSRELLIIDEEN